jgi:hypothetical protein
MCEVCDDRRSSLSRRRILVGAAATMALSTASARALAQTIDFPDVLAVYPPPGFDFAETSDSVEEEEMTMDEFYQNYFDGMSGPPNDRAYGLALANQILGIVRNDPAFVLRAGGLYRLHAQSTPVERERGLARYGEGYCRALLTGRHPAAPEPPAAVKPVVYAKDPPPPQGFRRIILGRSVIRVTGRTVIKTQVDRVTRDWLLGFRVAGMPGGTAPMDLFPSHEGARLNEIIGHTGARVEPVWGYKAVRSGDDWYAPDAEGRPRFMISPDKVREYPSTIVVDDRTVVVNDSHGVSAVAWAALDAGLVLACGDHRGKMDAAYYLAEAGVNVYTPTDRLMGLLIGARTRGTIVGSAPVTKTAEGAEIGNRPIAVAVDEPIVVSDAVPQYPLQYYDTPLRYFRALGDYLNVPLRLQSVMVTEYGDATEVVATATRTGAAVLGMRVKSPREHDAVARWLAADPGHRAILFHTAAYADGYKLFAEFPAQTGFGDIRPEVEG